MEAFSQAGLILQNPALSPCEIKPEVVFSNTADGARDKDEEDLSELFDDEVKDKQNVGARPKVLATSKSP